MIISRTPYRISFFGGGTDYPAWYREHGGAVLATTINKYCYINCRYLPPFFEHRIRIVYSRTESVHTIDEISHPSVRECLRFLKMDRGIEIHHDGDLPARSGMGSSSAFTVGLLNALYALQGKLPSKCRLAKESIMLEQEILKETVGCQDQIMAAYGGFNHITFLPNDAFSVRPMTLPAGRIEELNSHMMLFYTGLKRTASDIADSFVKDIDARRRQLRLMKELIEESITILSNGKEITGFGALLHEAWQAKRSLSPAVSNAFVDEIYDDARSAGAIGGKIAGAGGGGFMMLFVPPSKQKKVREKLSRLIQVPFEFENSGSQIIFYEPGEDFSAQEKERKEKDIEAFKELSECLQEPVINA